MMLFLRFGSPLFSPHRFFPRYSRVFASATLSFPFQNPLSDSPFSFIVPLPPSRAAFNFFIALHFYPTSLPSSIPPSFSPCKFLSLSSGLSFLFILSHSFTSSLLPPHPSTLFSFLPLFFPPSPSISPQALLSLSLQASCLPSAGVAFF